MVEEQSRYHSGQVTLVQHIGPIYQQFLVHKDEICKLEGHRSKSESLKSAREIWTSISNDSTAKLLNMEEP